MELLPQRINNQTPQSFLNEVSVPELTHSIYAITIFQIVNIVRAELENNTTNAVEMRYRPAEGRGCGGGICFVCKHNLVRRYIV